MYDGCACCYVRCAEKAGTSGQGICGCCYASDTSGPSVNQGQTNTTAWREIIPGDADLPESDDDTEGGEDAVDASGVVQDEPEFLTPSSIKLEKGTVTGIEWLQPSVSAAYVGSIGASKVIL